MNLGDLYLLLLVATAAALMWNIWNSGGRP
jgi:hypothetical protein